MNRIVPLCLFFLSLSALSADLALPDVEGLEHRLSDYRGQWVVVNYWATWCPPCLKEIPELVGFHEARDDAVVLGVNYEAIDVELLRQFVDDYFISYPVLLGSPGEASPLGRVTALPTTFLVSPAGEVVARHLGELDAERLEQYIRDYQAR